MGGAAGVGLGPEKGAAVGVEREAAGAALAVGEQRRRVVGQVGEVELVGLVAADVAEEDDLSTSWPT
jgi:hypothetical protein